MPQVLQEPKDQPEPPDHLAPQVQLALILRYLAPLAPLVLRGRQGPKVLPVPMELMVQQALPDPLDRKAILEQWGRRDRLVRQRSLGSMDCRPRWIARYRLPVRQSSLPLQRR